MNLLKQTVSVHEQRKSLSQIKVVLGPVKSCINVRVTVLLPSEFDKDTFQLRFAESCQKSSREITLDLLRITTSVRSAGEERKKKLFSHFLFCYRSELKNWPERLYSCPHCRNGREYTDPAESCCPASRTAASGHRKIIIVSVAVVRQ